MENTQAEERPRCVSCGAKLRGKYCHKCGEKVVKPSDFALVRFFQDVLKKITHLDSRVLRSFGLLVGRPGWLTSEYLRGRRRPYLKPVQLFFVVNLVYFLTIGWSNFRTYENPLHSQLRNPYRPVVEQMLDARFGPGDTEGRQDFELRFDRQNHLLAKSLLILIVPLLALSMWALYPGRYFGEHLITALHFQALMLVWNMVLGIVLRGGLSAWLPLPAGIQRFSAEVSEPLFWVVLWAFLTFRSVYASHWAATLLRALGFALLWLPVVILYRFLVFLATFYTA
ncbi:MAG: DUF3667 domain-containing protein [Saprospiraceae bacterium]|nr:DUF3667 domain-containing protein [Saprospiraceae bacterium]